MPQHCNEPPRRRQFELGISEHTIGQPGYGGDGRWCAFNPAGMTKGSNTTGVVVDFGVLNLTRCDARGRGKR